MEKERDHTKFLIQRFDTYITGANTKGNFLLAFNTFLCGVIITNYKNLIFMVEKPDAIICLNVLLCILIVLGLIADALIIKAVYPFLTSGNSSKDKYHSMIFFKSVSEFESDLKYSEELQKQSDSEVDEDMRKQAYCLAKGLKSKYNDLAMAMRLIFGELFILLLILVIIIFF
jgi:hypothetical protein